MFVKADDEENVARKKIEMTDVISLLRMFTRANVPRPFESFSCGQTKKTI